MISITTRSSRWRSRRARSWRSTGRRPTSISTAPCRDERSPPTPRDGSPLYTAIGTAFYWIAKGTPAHALNLASAVEGALACAVIVLVGVEMSGSVAAAAAAALLFATSYTFWSQSIIAEVYALH